MARGYEVEVSADARDFDRSIRRDVIEPVEDAEDALQDLQRQGEKTGKSLGDDISTGAKQGMDDVKNEAGQTAREAAASFDGSAESIGDAFQEVAANAFGGFGPAGAAAGLAAAAGIGLATAAFNEAQEAAADAKEEAYAFAFAALDSGKIAAEASAFRKITEDTEKMSEAQKIAKATGTDLTEVIKTMATGNGLPNLIDQLNKAAEAGSGNGYELNGLVMMLKGAQEGFQLGAAGAGVFSEYLFKLAEQTGEATGEVDYLGRAIVTLPDGKEVVIDAATQTASENITRVDEQLNAVDGKTAEAVLDVKVNDSAFRSWWSGVQSRAAQGITVNAKPGQGRFWQ